MDIDSYIGNLRHRRIQDQLAMQLNKLAGAEASAPEEVRLREEGQQRRKVVEADSQQSQPKPVIEYL